MNLVAGTPRYLAFGLFVVAPACVIAFVCLCCQVAWCCKTSQQTNTNNTLHRLGINNCSRELYTMFVVDQRLNDLAVGQRQATLDLWDAHHEIYLTLQRPPPYSQARQAIVAGPDSPAVLDVERVVPAPPLHAGVVAAEHVYDDVLDPVLPGAVAAVASLGQQAGTERESGGLELATFGRPG